MTDPHPRDDGDLAADQDFGVLLGWTADKLGERVILRMQSAKNNLAPGEQPREFTYFLKREQAVLLGNFLYQLTGDTPPQPRSRGKLSRLFGRP